MAQQQLHIIPCGYDANTSARGWARKSNFETTSGGILVSAVARLLFCCIFILLVFLSILFQRCCARLYLNSTHGHSIICHA